MIYLPALFNVWIAEMPGADVFLTLLLLIVLELVLGVDNIVVITLISQRLPLKRQALARRVGLGFAIITRLILLAFAFALIKLVQPIFHLGDHPVSIRDLLLFFGGLFLLFTAIKELAHDIRGKKAEPVVSAARTFWVAIFKIIAFDILFSLDSVITAVGVAKDYWVMAVAIIVAVLMMILASDILAYLIKTFWRIRLLALCFLGLVSFLLLSESVHLGFDRTYLYVALLFSIFVEAVNSLHEKFNSKRSRR